MQQNKQHQTTDVSCKVQYENDIRRFSFALGTLQDLSNKIEQMYAFPAGTAIAIKYKDEDGDLITLARNEDISMALSCTGSPLRLHVTTAPAPVIPSNFVSAQPESALGPYEASFSDSTGESSCSSSSDAADPKTEGDAPAPPLDKQALKEQRKAERIAKREERIRIRKAKAEQRRLNREARAQAKRSQKRKNDDQIDEQQVDDGLDSSPEDYDSFSSSEDCDSSSEDSGREFKRGGFKKHGSFKGRRGGRGRGKGRHGGCKGRRGGRRGGHGAWKKHQECRSEEEGEQREFKRSRYPRRH